MKYSKPVVLSLMILTLFSASCLIATYKINKDIEKINISSVAMLNY